MKKLFPLLLSLLCLPCVLRANGDPVLEYYANIRSCNPVPLKVSEVQVVREDLDIRVNLPYAHVKVAYQLKNNSGKAIHVNYGFPVDFTDIPVAAGPDRDKKNVVGTAVKDVTFRQRGRELQWTHSDEIVETVEDEDFETGETFRVQRARLWTYTVLDFKPGETSTLEVEYSVLIGWSTDLYALNMSPLSRYFPSGASLSYDFTPAKHWGNGKADVFQARIDGSALPKQFLKSIDKYSYDGPRASRAGSVWTISAENFDFSKAKPVELRFWEEIGQDERYVSWGDPLKSCAVPAEEYKLKASGAQSRYPAANLQDGSLATAWVAPGDGVGATLELTFASPRRVSDILLYNGYHKSADLWSSNSRIKRLKMEVTRADGYADPPVEVDLSTYDEFYYTLYKDRVPRYREPSLLSVTTETRIKFGRETRDKDGELVWVEVPATSEYVSHIRLTVLEVVPGEKYADLCLSDLVVLDGFFNLAE